MTSTTAQSSTRRGSGFALALPALLLMVIFFILPVAALLLRSVTEPEPGLQNYRELFATSTYTRIFLNTFLVAGITTAVTLVIAYPVAWLLAVLPGRKAMIKTPFVAPKSGRKEADVPERIPPSNSTITPRA